LEPLSRKEATLEVLEPAGVVGDLRAGVAFFGGRVVFFSFKFTKVKFFFFFGVSEVLVLVGDLLPDLGDDTSTSAGSLFLGVSSSSSFFFLLNNDLKPRLPTSSSISFRGSTYFGDSGALFWFLLFLLLCGRAFSLSSFSYLSFFLFSIFFELLLPIIQHHIKKQSTIIGKAMADINIHLFIPRIVFLLLFFPSPS